MRKILKIKIRVVYACFALSQLFISIPNAYAQNFTDNFENNNYGKWKHYGGAWKIKNKQYTNEANSGYTLVKDILFTSFIFNTDLSLKKSGSAGIIFNVSSPSSGKDSMNGYCAILDSEKDSILLYKIRKFPDTEKKEQKRETLAAVPYKTETNKIYHLRLAKETNAIELFINETHVISVVDKAFPFGSAGLMSNLSEPEFDNVSISSKANSDHNWSWVKGAIYLPTNCVNQIEQWENFDSLITDRELLYAEVYGFNLIRVYLHYLVWEKDKTTFLKNIETFLTLAEKHHIKTVFTFFDDIWGIEPHLGPQLPPVEGKHNRRWAQCPGDKIKNNYAEYKPKLKAYVQDVVKTHANDPRIAFWEPYSEPGFLKQGKQLQATKMILNDSRIWTKETGTSLPMTNTADPGFQGAPYSDFYSWHSYDRAYGGPKGTETIVTECLNRSDQTVGGIIENFANKKTGYIIWELGIGRDNARFNWVSPKNAPEPSMPFQGLIYPDGHPWDTNEVGLIRGNLEDMPVFKVKYYSGNFIKELKWSFTPCIDFDLGDERGTGSPDASIGIDKDSFSIQWTGQILSMQQGEYSFIIDTDNISRLYIDNKQVLNKTSNINREEKVSIFLKENQLYNIKIDYIHFTGNASMHVYWSGPGFSKTILPGRRAAYIQKPITKETLFSTD